ncbi:MAG: hypothetical protein WCX28_13165 [Bacteriovoracaceae bacterium]|nr:hypothetical protein [Bacteroidota bacterium]
MRQYKIFVLAIQVILLPQALFSGFERTAQPATVLGRALSGSASLQFENVWINPAAVTAATSVQSLLFYSPSPFQLPQLSSYGCIGGFTLYNYSFAMGFQTFGFSLYRESAVSMSIGTSVAEDMHAGVTFHLYQLSISRYGSSVTEVLDVGSVYSLSEVVNVGVAMNNVTGSKFGGDDDIPRSLISGISLNIEDRATVNFDLIKDLRYPVSHRAGIELLLHEIVAVRAGVQGGVPRLFGGFSISIIPFRIDYSIATHNDLGLSHSIGIAIE